MHIKALVTLVIFSVFIISAGEKITPVVTEFSIDTSLYDNTEDPRIYQNKIRYHTLLTITSGQTKFYTGPFVEYNVTNSSFSAVFFGAYLKKNSTQIDLYSIKGKCGTIDIPSLFDTTFRIAIFSQTFIDNDPEWELLANFYNNEGESHFTLFDYDGTELLTDEGVATLGFDGFNTYVVKGRFWGSSGASIKSWRFRTNINQPGGSLLKKSASASAAAPVMMTYGMADGSYRVTLAPSSGGATQMQMFDLAGRCLFSKLIENITRPVSFIVPENNVPQTPFITKVSNSSGATVKKELLVK